MDVFELSFEWTRVLFSFQYHLAQRDISYETNLGKRILKQRWLEDWQTSIQHFLQTLIPGSDDSTSHVGLFTDFADLQREIAKLLAKLDDRSRMAPKVVLLEVCLFIIYHPLGIEEDEQYKHLNVCDRFRSAILDTLCFYTKVLELESYYVYWFKQSYRDYTKKLQEVPNSSLNLVIGGLVGAVVIAVTAAFALPLVVGMLAPLLAPGLSGAAAASAVLAALGGGAIAAGGFGMAGGVAVIVGGGAILGASTGTGIGALFAQSPEAVIPHAAKFLVVFDDIVLSRKDIPADQVSEQARRLLQELKETIRSYEDELDELNLRNNAPQERIQNLEKVVHYLKKALEIAQRKFMEFLRRNNLN